MKKILLLLLFVKAIVLEAKVTLPDIIGDNMVLQHNDSVLLWGKSSYDNKLLKVHLPWLMKAVTTKTDKYGEWSVSIKTPNPGGPYDIHIVDGDTLVVNNIYIGEVWLCLGQSNMEIPVKGYYGQPVYHSNQTIANVNKHLPIHLFQAHYHSSKVELDNLDGSWNEHEGKAVANFSATAYYFGLQLYQSLQIPIGLINSSKGGSKIEPWIPKDVLKLFPNISLKHLEQGVVIDKPEEQGAVLYNAMIHPLKNLTIKGVIWYQGESNLSAPIQYESLLPCFVGALRKLFRKSDLPFYYVQIAPFTYGDKDGQQAALFRESQMKCEKYISHSGMVVLTDAGTEFSIHPFNKQLVGERLAYMALSNLYGMTGISSIYPTYESKQIVNGKIILNFKTDCGLTSFGKELSNFEIAGRDRKFIPAKASVIKESNKVVVWSDMVNDPVAVRYAFRNYVDGDLFGTNGLPVSTFRTDF